MRVHAIARVSIHCRACNVLSTERLFPCPIKALPFHTIVQALVGGTDDGRGEVFEVVLLTWLLAAVGDRVECLYVDEGQHMQVRVHEHLKVVRGVYD